MSRSHNLKHSDGEDSYLASLSDLIIGVLFIWGSLRKRNLKYVKRVETGTQRYSVGMDTPRFGLILGRNSNWPAASSLTQSWYRSSWDSGQPKVQGTFADVIGI